MRKQRIKSTYQWKKHKAKVLSSRMRRGSIFGVTPHYPFVMDVKYEYTIDTKRYISNHYAIESCMEPSINFAFNESEAEKEILKYRAGQEIEVFINPLDLSDSVIRQGMSSTNTPSIMYLLLVGVILGIFLYIKCMI